MRWARRHLFGAVAVLAASFLAVAGWAADEPETAPLAVIPPGQEALLLAMLGRGVALPDGCELSDGRVEHNVVKATYTCPLGPVVVELAHPEAVEEPRATTEQFALRVESGSPPESLLDAIAAGVRKQEDQFQWVRLAAENDAALDPASGEAVAPDEPR